MRLILTFITISFCIFPMQSHAATTVIAETVAANLMNRFAQNAANIFVSAPSAIAVASANQTGLVQNTNFGTLPPATPVVMNSTGIILTNGNINGGNNNLALPGDTDVFNALSNHPAYTTTGTFDAASLQFDFIVTQGVTAVTFDLVFASNEVIGAITPDTVVVMVDGVNYATLTNGLLLSNQTAGILVATPVTPVVTGFSSASAVQTVTAPLNPNVTAHTIKIAIADNVNGQNDSAVIVANLNSAISSVGGMGVGDIFPPVLTPPANVNVEATGPTTTVNLGTPVVTDNVDNPAPAATPLPIGPYPVGATVVTWSATDAAGNVGTTTQTVTVTDTTPPVVTPPAAQVFSTASPTMAADITAYLATVTAVDLVGVVSPVTNNAPVGGFPVGATTVTFTAVDAAGNAGTASTVITVTAASILNNTTAATLASRLTQFDANITASTAVLTAVANQTGLVESTSFGTLAGAPLSLSQQGIILTTGNITGTGNSLGPLAGDADVFNALTAHPSFATTGTADAATLQFSFTTPVNTTSVDFDLIYATNEALAGAALPDAVVMMVDGVNRATFTNGLLLSNLNGAFLNASNGTLIAGYTNLSQALTLTALVNPALTTHTIKISIADNNTAQVDSAIILSNMRISTATQNGMGLLGTDYLPPIITPAANVAIEATGPTSPVNLGVPNVTDNVDPNPAIVAAPAGPYPVGQTIVTWTATDAAGNVGTATQTVTISDNTAPVVTAPAAQIFSTASPTMAADIAAHLATVVATDAVGIVPPIANNAPAAGFPVGNTTVTYTALDAAGNIGTATTVITVTAASIIADNVAANLATRLTQYDANITLLTANATAIVNQTGLVESTNFGTLAAAPLSLPQKGIMLTTGNITGTGNNIAQAGDPDVFNALSVPPYATTGTSDAASLTFTFTVPVGTPSVSFDLIYATNEAVAGIANPDAVVVMVDGINRGTFTNGTLLANLNGAFLNASNGTLISGYTNLSQTQTLTTLLNPALATHTVKISIADNTTSLVDSALIIANMRISTNTQNGMGLFGTDFLSPVVVPAANVAIEATGPTSVVNLGVPTVTDNIDPNPVVTALPAGPYPVGLTVVNWTATDAAGNVGTASQTVTVSDTTAPVITPPATQTFSTVNPTMAANIAAHLATVVAVDAVGVAGPIANNAPLVFPVGNTTVTFTATDAAGNVGTATTVITITSASIISNTNAITLATRLTQFDANITLGTATAAAIANQTGLVESTNFGTLGVTPLTLPQQGIMLTTGNITGTGNNLGGLAGDTDVFNALSTPPYSTTGTSDAATLQFSFTVPANVPSVSFDLIYATNEILAGIPAPDAVVVMVDGVNRGVFTNGSLLANLNGAFLNASNGTLISGYTNLSQAQTLTALLDPLLTTHTIKITIADNSTAFTDSAILMANMRTSTSTQNGMGLLAGDNFPPIITPPANVVAEATALNSVVNLGVPNVTDNLDPNPAVTPVPAGPFPVGLTIVTWNAIDAAGNIGTATQTVTVNDTTAPVVTAPPARTFSTASPTLAADLAAHLATVTAVDLVTAAPVIVNNAPLVFPVGNTTVTFTATDAAGNIGTGTTVITITSATIIANANATTLATRLTQFDPNITFAFPATTAAVNQTGLVETTNFGTLAAAPLTLPQTGIILTTGNITGTGNNLGPQPGDTDVFNALSTHISYNTTGTSDASSLQFTFTVPANTPSVSFDLIYATNEVLAGVAFADAVAIMVDGVNKAVYTNGLLLSNLNGAFLNASNGTLIPGYTNLTQTMTLTALLNPLLTSHTIKISIADNSTALTDSALIISNMRTSAATQNGMGTFATDFFPPVVTAPPAVIAEANAPNSTVNLGVPNVTDNLDPNPAVIPVPAGPYPVGLTVVTWTATDAAGNVGTATQNVTITDTIAPTIIPPAVKTFSTFSPTLAADIAAHLATVTATDLVTVAPVIVNDAPLVFPAGNTTVTFTATDAAGNVGTATTFITLEANPIINNINATTLATRLTQYDANIVISAPALTAITNQTGLVESGNFGTLTLPAPALPVALTLPQPGIMLTTGNLTGTGNNLGPLAGDNDIFTALTTTAPFASTGTSDAASLQFTFTVPANSASVTLDFIYATNEAIAGVPFPDAAVIMIDGVNRAVFATGAPLLSNFNGNIIYASNGTLIPGYANISQANTMTALLDPLLATHTIKISIADNTDANVDSALILSNMRITTSTQSGMGVGDFLSPVVTAPADITVEATGATSAINLGTAFATDNVDLNPVTLPAPAGPFALGSTQITWSSTDAAGNVGSALQTVTVVDTTPPVISAPASATFAASSQSGLSAATASLATLLVSASATDAVGVRSITNNAPVQFPIGTTQVTFTATDITGNVSTGFTDIIISAFVASVGGVAVANGTDQIPPVVRLIGSSEVTVLQTAAVAAGAPAVLYADPGATVNDNFDGPTPAAISATTSIDTSIAGTTVLIYNATDLAGNTSQVVRIVHVVTPVAGVDLLPPVVTLSPLPTNATGHDIMVAATNFTGIAITDPSLTSFFTLTTAVDNVGGSGLSGAITNDAPATIPVGKTVVTFTATDVAGNKGTATATITVSGVVQNTGAATDFDLDTMPDAWEIAIFGDSTLKLADPGTDFDGDGISDALERLLGTDPKVTNTNPSGASTDLKDLVDINNPSDSDGDGIIDALEDNDSVLDASIVTGIPATNGSTTFSIRTGGYAVQSVAVSPITTAPFNVITGYGLFSYNVLTPVGATITVQINSTQPFGTNSQFYKVDAVGNYSLIPASNVVMVGANTINLTLTDGGPFDLDGIANGVIVDPVSFGASPTVLGATGGISGGGCTLQTDARFDPLLPTLFAISLFFMLTRKKKRTTHK